MVYERDYDVAVEKKSFGGAVSRWGMDILQFIHKLTQRKNRASYEDAVFLG
jgi:hypothetical protein